MFEAFMNLPIAWLNGWELPAIIVVVLLLFGGTKIPQLMRGLGRGVGEFKKGVSEGKTMLENIGDEDDGEAAKKS
ncbi:MAG: twin-arginine translocase TatA/TatE family subunit [Fimbriimonadales bacterium]